MRGGEAIAEDAGEKGDHVFVGRAELLPLALTNPGHFTSLRVEADRRIRGLSLHLERGRSHRSVRVLADLHLCCEPVHVRQAISGSGPETDDLDGPSPYGWIALRTCSLRARRAARRLKSL